MVRKAIGAAGSTAFGFSLIEVVISMFLTIIVMGAVFGLLLQGQQAFRREPGVVDVQQSARSALAMVSADVLQAGTNLPPEFPAFTPFAIDATVGDRNPDVIEIVGNIQSPGQQQQLPEKVDTFTPPTSGDATITLNTVQTNLQMNDLVVVYNDWDGVGGNPQPIWWMGTVGTVTPGTPPSTNARITVAAAGTRYNSVATGDITPAFVSRVSVVRYAAGLQSDETASCATQQVNDPCVLRRSVDFGASQPVGTVFDFQVTYAIGAGTVLEPTAPTAGPLLPTTIVTSVNLQVAARSLQANEFIRKTFSTVTNPRNLTSAVGIRTATNPSGPAYQ